MYTGLGEDIAPMSSGPRGGRAVKQGVSKKARKVGGGIKKRRRALKTVFTG